MSRKNSLRSGQIREVVTLAAFSKEQHLVEASNHQIVPHYSTPSSTHFRRQQNYQPLKQPDKRRRSPPTSFQHLKNSVVFTPTRESATMAISDLINPRCYRNFAQGCLLYFPDRVVHYAAIHLDTMSKFLNHVLIVMAVCNFLCLLNAWTISFLSFTAAFLLCFQNACLLLVLNNGKLSFSPRFLAPTEFMVGLCLGISIGGTILSFFVCLTFGKFHAFCEHAKDSGEYSCGDWKHAINGVWWWSSVVFWLDLLTCLLVAAARHEIADNTMSQYASIDNANMTIAQYEEQRFKENQQNEAPSQQGAFVGNYNNIPDVHHQIPASHPQFAQPTTSHQNSQPPRQAQDPLLV